MSTPAFSFLFFGTLCIPTGQVFGRNTSAFAKVRTLLAQYIFDNEECDALVDKYKYLID